LRVVGHQLLYSSESKREELFNQLKKSEFKSSHQLFTSISIDRYLKYFDRLPCLCGSYLKAISINHNQNSQEFQGTFCQNKIENNKMNNQTLKPQHQRQQEFIYYIDPRLSINFINIFNSLKRQISNEGFQF
jgi:hypothetical protein